jgi:hypothetical protein
MTSSYIWHNAIYDTQRWEYLRVTGNSSSKLGEVHRVIRARQSYDDRVHDYQAFSFTTEKKMVFNTRAEAEAWVTACERME